MRLTRYRFGEFEFDPASRELRRAGVLLPVPLKSLECLAYLVAHRERAVGRDELVSAVWGRTDVSDTVITQTMRRARRALDDAGNRQTIVRTIPGFGYRWIAAVDALDHSPDSEATHKPVTAVGEPLRGPVAAPPSEAAETHADLVSTPGGLPRRLFGGAFLVLVGLVLGGLAYLSTREKAAHDMVPSDGLVMVLPVAVDPPDREYSWVRLGAMEYAADRLRGSALKVAPSEQTLHLQAASRDRATPGGGAGPDDAMLQTLLAKSGAQWLLVPQAFQERNRWRVQLRAVGHRSDVRLEAQGDTPLQAMAIATDAWLRRIGRATSVRPSPTPFQERLRRIDAELDAGQLDAAREQIAAAPAKDRTSPRMLVREGQLEYRAGRIAEAKTLFERAISHPAIAEDAPTRAKGLMGMGSVALRQERPFEAEQRYTDALDVLRGDVRNEDVGLLGDAYNGRGVARIQQGKLASAVSDMGLARVAMQEDGDVVSAAMVGSNVGRIEAVRNHWPQAVQEYDKAIEVFERFEVRDYLAATLGAKASAQLALVEPAEATETIARAQRLVPSIEDATLLSFLATIRIRVALHNGRLDEAANLLQTLSPQVKKEREGVVAELEMALAIARGDRPRAAALAARIPPASKPVEEDLAIMAVQAAGNAAVARAWRDRLSNQPSERLSDRAFARSFASAIVERRFGERDAALAAANKAMALANREGSPDDRVRAGIIRALVLLDGEDSQTAFAVLGELDAYVTADYRAAWLAWTLYRHVGNTAMAERAHLGMDSLRGERQANLEPTL
ncbi:winged helix-turn-helix domain-containing protein [Lysobacter auxotrophicus]|uniref:Winged helix-turn-helix domain-containing protein n=1 Tax=Lysobacter auxotrophicus TaxID=2992573 RepID=A0ABN6UK08_9GAMM|nr:winged helix-turn-helix domain-containing protein [Lysobacter auxotrophicus]BDU16642.1 winged helix-turn-helix domain-containing protein [Lysobacter auxotrophicus]